MPSRPHGRPHQGRREVSHRRRVRPVCGGARTHPPSCPCRSEVLNPLSCRRQVGPLEDRPLDHCHHHYSLSHYLPPVFPRVQNREVMPQVVVSAGRDRLTHLLRQ